MEATYKNPVAREHPVLQRHPLSNCLLSLTGMLHENRDKSHIHYSEPQFMQQHFGAETVSPSRWPYDN